MALGLSCGPVTMQVLKFVVVLLCYRAASASTIVVPTSTEQNDEESPDTNKTVAKPEMYYFHVDSDIKYRFANTLISTRIVNPAEVAQEVFFSAVLPETAFISGFNMEVDGKVYEAYVKEKEEAKQDYEQAVQQGQTAAHVALTARDSNRFTVSMNVEPQKKIIFNLTYEELLTRKLGSYANVINLDPGQIVRDLRVVVRIQENSKITDLKVPALKTSNEIEKVSKNDEKNPLAVIEHPTPESAIVTFAPNADQQEELAAEGLKGQLIVKYDVDRTSKSGEFLVREGYFVHFFSPEDLPPLRKQATFVLDVSGSMAGRKMEQLRQAMTTILDDLNEDDLFSIVLFSQTAKVWDPTMNETEVGAFMGSLDSFFPPKEEEQRERPSPSVIVKADPDNIAKAKKFVSKLDALAATAIYDGLMTALEISKIETEARENEQKPEPIIIFLTDGLPNVRVSDPEQIVKEVTRENTKNSTIFSLALGNDADFNFLKKLSLRNSGFARKIYEASDTALQLTDFYREISSPLLANVTFNYAPEEVEQDTVTKNVFRRLFSGSELVVAGMLRSGSKPNAGHVTGSSVSGKNQYLFEPIIVPTPDYPKFHTLPPEDVPKHNTSSMERLWAYLTIQQLLEEDAAKDYDHNDKNKTSAEKQRALKLALEYSFVTSLTSLVVVKPNETKSVDTEDASKPQNPQGFPGAGFYPTYPSQPSSGGFGGGFPAFAPPSMPVNDVQPVHELAVQEEAEKYTTEAPTSTFAPAPTPAPARLVGLDDLTWLPSVLKNDTIHLPTGGINTVEVLQFSSANETDVAHQECKTPVGEPGHCRHLRFCVLDVFANKTEDYIPYLCHIEGYAGVCCPDYI